MNEDYLWDKTGSDTEIEKLEQALKIFRYEETAAPVIHAKILPFVKKESSRKSFPFLRAIAACLALASISLGVWILFSNAKNEIAGDTLQNSVMITETINPLEQISEDRVPVQPETEDKPAFTKTLFIEKNSKPKNLPVSKSDFRNKKPKKKSKTENAEKIVRLTEEEKYAFEQLMLALSITSSKLKIVKEKVDSAEIQTADLK
jgi:hypothetical protein